MEIFMPLTTQDYGW